MLAGVVHMHGLRYFGMMRMRVAETRAEHFDCALTTVEVKTLNGLKNEARELHP